MFDLYYTGTKNARIHAKVVIPKNGEEKMPAVLMFHGLSGASEEWRKLLSFTSQGYAFAKIDLDERCVSEYESFGILGGNDREIFLNEKRCDLYEYQKSEQR